MTQGVDASLLLLELLCVPCSTGEKVDGVSVLFHQLLYLSSWLDRAHDIEPIAAMAASFMSMVTTDLLPS